MTEGQECILRDAIIEFDEDGHALSPSQVRELALILLKNRKEQENWKIKLSHAWLNGFMGRNPGTFKRQKCYLENYRATALSAENLSNFIMLLSSVYKKYKI